MHRKKWTARLTFERIYTQGGAVRLGFKGFLMDRVVFLGNVHIADILWMEGRILLRCGDYVAKRLVKGISDDISWALGVLVKAYGVRKCKFYVLDRDIPKQWKEMANRFNKCGSLFIKEGNK